MKDLLRQADRIPVTLVIAIAYVTLFALSNMRGPDESVNETLHNLGWLRPIDVVLGQPWRMITAAFLHGGLLHIGFNLFMLLMIGPPLEQALGSVRFTVLYLVSAIGGHIGVCLLYPVYQPVIGGSGALFGMMGSLLALNMRSGRHMLSFLEFDGPRRLVGLIVINLVLGMLIPFVSNTAHVGGLIAGFCVTFLWLAPGRAPTPALLQWRHAITALFASLLFWSLQPATRWDYLMMHGMQTSGSDGEALRRAAAMSYFDLPEASEREFRALRQKLDSRR